MQNQTKQDVAKQVAHDYIVQHKKWQNHEFKIEIVSEGKDGIVVVDAVHVDDLRGKKGSNKSVQLHVDVAKKAVIKELGYQ